MNASAPGLSRDEQRRYERQLALDGIGEAGQARLKAARVAVVGAGGLGSPAAFYLAAAGVGNLTLVDSDVVDLGNLQRQILHTTAELGAPKVESARRRLAALNPEVRVVPLAERLEAANAAAILRGHDFVVEATDTFASKFVLADACHAAGVPCCHAGVHRFEGHILTVRPGRSACLRCVFEAPPDTGDGAPRGPLGVVPGVLGTLQAAEAIRYIVGLGELLTDRLLTFDARRAAFREVRVRRRADCSLCG